MKKPLLIMALISLILFPLTCAKATADDSENVAEYAQLAHGLRLFMRSKNPDDIALRKQILNAPAHLRQALATLNGEKLNLNVNLPPVPKDKNASYIYNSIPDMNPYLPDYANVLSCKWAYTPEELQKVREVLASNKAYFDKINQGAQMPLFQTNPMQFSHNAKVRAIARALATKSYILAEDGQENEAVNTSSVILAVGRHLYQNKALISSLVGDAIDSIGYSSFRGILYHAPSPEIAKSVDDVLSNTGDVPSFKEPLLGFEAACFLDNVNSVRTGKPSYLEQTELGELQNMIKLAKPQLKSLPDKVLYMIGKSLLEERVKQAMPLDQTNVVKKAFKPDELKVWNNLFFEGEADYFRDVKRFVDIANAPIAEQVAYMRGRDKKQTQSSSAALKKIDIFISGGETSTFGELMPSQLYWNVCRNTLYERTQRNLVIAMARVFQQRDKNGMFPDSIVNLPIDPWDGAPLRYRKTEKGFVLYSVGEKGDYDGVDRKDDIRRIYRIEFPLVKIPLPKFD
jgi:hypothetical protein